MENESVNRVAIVTPVPAGVTLGSSSQPATRMNSSRPRRLFTERVIGLMPDVRRLADGAKNRAVALVHFGRLDRLINNAGLGLREISPRFLAKRTKGLARPDRHPWQRMNFATKHRPGFSPMAHRKRRSHQRRRSGCKTSPERADT
jgi:hypothetical protein